MAATARPAKFPRVPYVGIRWLVGRLHVGTTDAEVEADMSRRMARAKATPAETREAIRYALAVHNDNRALYRAVMSGVLS